MRARFDIKLYKLTNADGITSIYLFIADVECLMMMMMMMMMMTQMKMCH